MEHFGWGLFKQQIMHREFTERLIYGLCRFFVRAEEVTLPLSDFDKGAGVFSP